ncbi:hypothetical protein [Deinococcus aerophilus]|uniref:DUF4333 domain-containing protein n=1 Tax=Deinococcus aerophilus TaxID=522488 RepID=A0ABQ2GLT7_9DEIO|nr:hypothetical protein [Deinococcus aerophilus]GGM01738.1 hypothetical protein GCM10010841_07780 [Deinococcus aerophilus]
MSKRARPVSPAAPREVTPTERSSALRTFLWILVAFVVGIGVLVATLAVQGRAVRDYAQAVRTAAQAGTPSTNVSYRQPCADVRPGPLPRGALTCDVLVEGGEVTVVMEVEGNRQYRIGP